MKTQTPPSGRRLTIEESRRVARRAEEFGRSEEEMRGYITRWRKSHAVTALEAAGFFAREAAAQLGMEVYYERADDKAEGGGR